MPTEKVYEVWEEQDGRLVMCIDQTLLARILADGYILCEATVEMAIGGLVGKRCRQVAIPRRWTKTASGGDLVDSEQHWRPQAA